MLFEKLSDNEKRLISNYIEAYGTNPDHESLRQANRAPLDWVLRHWNSEKENLFHLLGDNLILEKHINIEVDNTRIVRNLEEMSDSDKLVHGITYRNVFRRFWSWINHVSYENWEYLSKKRCENWNQGIFNRDYKVPVEDIESSWFDFEHLATNIYDGQNCILVLPDTDKPYQVKTGMRLTRLLDRILKAYPSHDFGTQELNALIDIIAIARTSTNSSFDLCLSIHPLDFMTMSDNDKNWNSCMAWKDHAGDYRQGTVECMNSPTVVVAYIKDEEPMNLECGYDTKWANKSWRQLFLVSEGAIIADKGYPFQYDATVTIVLDWLKELAKENWGIDYDFNGFICDNGGTIYTPAGNEWINGPEDTDTIALHVDWGFMYDDIGTLRRHNVLVNTKAIAEYLAIVKGSVYNIIGSGVSECMWCGGEIYGSEDTEDDYTSALVICDSCCPAEERWVCDECGEHYHRDELTYIPDLDVYLCDDCYNEKIFVDEFTGDMEWTDNEKPIYLAIGMNSANELVALKTPISVSDRAHYYNSLLETYFVDPEHMTTYMTPLANIHKRRWEPESANFCNVVFESDLTEKGLELFLDKSCYETIEMAREDYAVAPIPADFITNLYRDACPNTDLTLRLDDNGLTHYLW